MIDADTEAEIRRLFFGEHVCIGAIAAAVGVHRDVVTRVVDPDTFTNAGKPRPSALDPFVPVMRELLERYPTLTGTRLHRMLQDRGYEGSAVQVRRRIRAEGLRARPKEAFFELSALPGEEGQVDWMHVCDLDIDGTRRRLWGLVIVLSHSRACWLHLSFDQRIESVLRGHVEAFEHFGGVPRRMLYDNMKTVVIERRGDAIRFHERLTKLASHYLFSPVPCGPYRPHEKGRVERRIRDIRSSMLAGQVWTSVDEIRRAFRRWQLDVAYGRPVPDDDTMTVGQALEAERLRLLPLPEHPVETDEVRAVTVSKQPYVHYDTNRYSVPAELVGTTLSLVVSADTVRVLAGQDVVATHPRCWGRKQRIDDPAHLDALAASKRKAALTRGRDRVIALLPIAQPWYQALARRQMPMGPQTSRLLRLVEQYELEDIDLAIEAAIERGTPSVHSIERLLEQQMRQRHQPVEVPVSMPDRVRHIDVRTHDLGDYDEL